MRLVGFPHNEKQVQTLVSSWATKVLKLGKNQVVESVGEIPQGIYLIKSGLVKLTVPLQKKDQIISILNNRSIFGLNCLLNVPNTFSFTCLTEVELFFIPQNAANSLVNSSLIDFAVYHFNFEVLHLRQKVFRDSWKRADDRIINFLLSVNGHEKNGWLKITRLDIANYANCTKEHALRILSSLKKRGLIATDGHHIKPNQKLIRQKYPHVEQ
jgi:CRP-like cAMP-binding protein